jgi:hypothetical protein
MPREVTGKIQLTPPFFLAKIILGVPKIMTVKLLLVKSGEDIISDVSEMVIGGEEDDKEDFRRVVGYYLDSPCVVKIINQSFSSPDNDKNQGVEVSLHPWIPLTSDKKIPIPADWVITMVEPAPSLKKMYLSSVNKNGKDDQSISIDEQSVSNQSD